MSTKKGGCLLLEGGLIQENFGPYVRRTTTRRGSTSKKYVRVRPLRGPKRLTYAYELSGRLPSGVATESNKKFYIEHFHWLYLYKSMR